MLRWRLTAAAAILIPLFVLLYLDFSHSGGAPGVWLAPLGIAVAFGAAFEFCSMLGKTEVGPWRTVAVMGSVAVFGAAYVPVVWELFGEYPVDCPMGRLGWLILALAAVVMVTFLVEMAYYQAPGRSVVRIGITLGIVAYAGLLPAFLVLLRTWRSNGTGMVAFISMVLITKLSDTGAYFVGRSFGRRKLIPRISPGKTIEGSLGGFLSAIMASGLFFTLIAEHLDPPFSATLDWWRWTTYGIVVCAAGMVGDLAESLIKRDLGCKDSSTWLPGLGGVLDIVDSLLFAAPAAYFCWLVSLVR